MGFPAVPLQNRGSSQLCSHCRCPRTNQHPDPAGEGGLLGLPGSHCASRLSTERPRAPPAAAPFPQATSSGRVAGELGACVCFSLSAFSPRAFLEAHSGPLQGGGEFTVCNFKIRKLNSESAEQE